MRLMWYEMSWILVITPNLEDFVHTTAVSFDAQGVPVHSDAYRMRRLLNWFPLGLAYASMMFMRYVLMVLGLIAITTSLMDNSPTHGSWITGIALMVIGTGVIGVHGILSGTATGDFAGVRNTAKSVGIVDGAVYIGTSVQAIVTGLLVTQHGDAAKNPSAWTAWPIILIPFAIVGTILCARIFHALPARSRTPVVAAPPEPDRLSA